MTSCGKSGGWLRHWTCKHFEIWSCWLDENLFKEYFTMTDQTLLGSQSLAGKKIKAKQTNTGVENQTHRLLLTTVLDLVWFALVTAPWLLADAASHCTEARCATPPHHRRNANRWWPLLEKIPSDVATPEKPSPKERSSLFMRKGWRKNHSCRIHKHALTRRLAESITPLTCHVTHRQMQPQTPWIEMFPTG